ncbi:hypothetical protein D3C75_1322590 [compost metagenome]
MQLYITYQSSHQLIAVLQYFTVPAAYISLEGRSAILKGGVKIMGIGCDPEGYRPGCILNSYSGWCQGGSGR